MPRGMSIATAILCAISYTRLPLFASPNFPSQLNGLLQTDQSTPISGITIDANSSIDNQTILISTRSDDLGHFTFSLPNGAWTISPRASELNARDLLAPPTQTFNFNNTTNSTTFSARVSMAELSGTISDETTQPLRNIVLTAHDNSGRNNFTAISDAGGKYRFGLFPGTWNLKFDSQNLAVSRLFVADGPPSVTFTSPPHDITTNLTLFHAPFTISVTFVDELGQPLNGSLWARGISDVLDTGKYIDITNGFCQFIVPAGAWILSPDSFDLHNPDAARTALRRRLIVTNSIETHFIGRPYPPIPLLVGRLVDENDQPIPNTFIEDSDVTDVPGATTAEDGSFTLPLFDGTLFSLSVSNSQYVAPQLRLNTAPGSVIHKTLHAHKVTSHIILRPPGADYFISAIATTHVGVDTFQVSGRNGFVFDSSGNIVSSGGDLQLGLFDGEWNITVSDFYDGTSDTNFIVSIPSTNQVFKIKFPITATRFATLSGKLIDDLGAPIRTGVYASSAGRYDESTNSTFDGLFRFRIPADGWSLGVNVSPRTDANVPTNYTQLDFYFPATFQLTNGQTLDVGTLIVPQPSAHLTVNLVNATGEPLNTDDPYLPAFVLQLVARQTNTLGHAFAYSESESREVQTNKIIFDILPGLWTFEALEWISYNRLNDYGYASPPPFSMDLQPGDNEYNLRIDPVPSEPVPAILTAAITADATPHFRIYQPKLWPMDIESSTDLVHWQFHTNAFFNQDFAIGGPKTNLFYRAVQSP